MADASTINPALDRYNRYYNQVLASLQQSAGPYQTDSQLKNYLTRMMRPSYDQAILQRQQQTGQANAAIDADAASRGMGTSTWVTDAKNRQQTSQAADIAAMNGNYNSALYEALLGQIQQREQNRLNLMGQAQNIAGSMYDEFKKYDPLNSHGGNGGGGIGDDGGGSGGGGSGGGGGGGGGQGPTDEKYGITQTSRKRVPIENKITPRKAVYKPTSQNAQWLNKKTQWTK